MRGFLFHEQFPPNLSYVLNSFKETPNNASAAGGIGSCGIILDAGAAENALRPWKRALYWAFQGRFLDQDRVRA